MIYEEDCGVLSYEDNGYGEQSGISACRGTEKDTGKGEYAYCDGETKEQTVYYKYYTSVSAPYGATLWSLSQDYLDEIHYESTMDYIEEVKKINHLADDGIKAGQRIIFPYYSSEYIE